MPKYLSFPIAAALAMAPFEASATDQFATVETAYQHEGAIVVSSLYATSNQAAVDGHYVFDGYVMNTAEGVSVPWTVRVPVDLDLPDVAAVKFVSQDRVIPRHTYRFESGGASVEKSFYEIRGETSNGTLTVTDDPLPIIAWLVIGGSFTVLGTVGMYMFGCEKIDTKVTVDVKGTMTHETSCAKKM